MNRALIMNILRQQQPEFARLGVKSLAVFGSVARGNDSSESDLDILVNFNRPVGLFEFIRLKLRLEQLTGCAVNLVTPDALHPALRERILNEAVDVYF